MGLEQVELVIEVENEFDIRIDDADDYGQWVTTVGGFHDIVLRLVRAAPESKVARRPDLEPYLWNRIAELAAEFGHGMTPEQIERGTRFVEDLGYG